ncbi:MAG: hypothetical protein D6B26_00750 [Spirochaetaceae bacterium]|nr:MAG: hypothetical protein D6B26_00750 [Spirochaetaceae bacterium]
MKFKAIFLVFNVIIVFSMVLLFVLPTLLLDWDFSLMFWQSNWYLVLVCLMLIVGVNFFFFRYWRVYELLEQEDWDALQSFLKTEIFDKHRFRHLYIRLYIHTAIVRAKPDEISELRELLQSRNLRQYKRFALELGLPEIFRNDAPAMEEFFGQFIELATGARRLWLVLLYAFSLFLQKRLEEARPHIEKVLDVAKDPLLIVMSLYIFVAYSSDDSNVKQRIADTKALLKKRYSRDAMMRILEKGREMVVLLVLEQFVRDAIDWLYGEDYNND